ncbi:MAG TPA: hypothetical protein VFV52_13320 [Bacilli bacterium]|nr:hypothetical protein [Bacilli bacterium]
MNRQELLTQMQHTPLPQTMASFERTVSPQEAREAGEGAWLVVEYRHTAEDVLFQVVLQGDTAVYQTVQDGQAEVVRTSPTDDVGNVLRSDLLILLEEIEDEL